MNLLAIHLVGATEVEVVEDAELEEEEEVVWVVMDEVAAEQDEKEQLLQL